MSGFHDVQFPPQIARGMSGGPAWSTVVTTTESGYEQRNGNWAASRRRYTFSREPTTRAEVEELIAFFEARQGRLYGFRFKDWSDYDVGVNPDGSHDSSQREVIGAGDGGDTTFQIVKRYTSGTATITRNITRPVSAIKLYLAGVEQSSGYSVDYATGIATFTTAPGAGVEVAWTGLFDVPVRFETDFLDLAHPSASAAVWSGVSVVEVR